MFWLNTYTPKRSRIVGNLISHYFYKVKFANYFMPSKVFDL
ncbi:hypothetical protein DESAMIL20_1214 [Desulfurella amilsii]|uniref:Uncharacterized protein n=1 Tax=Desulfurella amilsii TaxID=1562698 RepID=A0A1X4XVV2_9BACT|nr:hypothetical protein DESAMIL20_1214 [Desulfurella amilsii]